jgi:hypothetical protein
LGRGSSTNIGKKSSGVKLIEAKQRCAGGIGAFSSGAGTNTSCGGNISNGGVSSISQMKKKQVNRSLNQNGSKIKNY